MMAQSSPALTVPQQLVKIDLVVYSRCNVVAKKRGDQEEHGLEMLPEE
jgi:hypothetical protein